MRMSRLLCIVASMLLTATMASAQTDLSGRVYHCSNIMEPLMNEALKELYQKMADARQQTISQFEQKKGRKPNDKEVAEIDQKLNEARAMAEAMKTGVSTSITVEFKDAANAVMKIDMKCSDAALKKAGVSWLKRKAIKASMAIAPKSQKTKYTVSRDTVVFISDEDRDTLLLSYNGKFLSGKMDEKTPFKLTRTK